MAIEEQKRSLLTHAGGAVERDGGTETERAKVALQEALLQVSKNAREAGFCKGLLEGTLLILESRERDLDETIAHVRGKLAEFEARNSEVTKRRRES